MNKLYLLALTLLLAFNSFATTYYVNVNSKGLRLGTSWTNAFTFLPQALYVAKSGDTVKVASGVYISDTADYESESAKRSYFNIARGLTILGGYPATGNPGDAQRDFVNNQTILSGLLKSGYNSNTIVRAYGIDTATVLDGFLVRGANEAAMEISNSTSLVIRNIVFEKNRYDAVDLIKSETKFYNCAFSNNGYAYGYTFNCTDGSTAAVYNCVFANNSMYYVFGNSNSFLSVINTTVANNGDKVLSGTNGGSTTFTNCILWNNRNNSFQYYGKDVSEFVVAGQSFSISNCITDVYYDGSNNTVLTASDPLFVNIYSPAGADNKFFTSDDGLQLTAPCSPGLNTGNNSTVAGISTDILGKPRIYNNGTVDMGAYERQAEQGAHFTTVYVNASTTNTGNNSGGSWQNAFHTLQEALMYCADTVKVAAGTYFPVNSINDSIFFITKKRVLLGGYPSSGSPLDADRNPAVNKTILTDHFSQDIKRIATIKVFRADSTSRIDGFEFNNPATSPPNINLTTPMYISTGSKIRITNCVFKDNFAGDYGAGAMFITDSSSPVIENCQFIENHAANGQSIVCNGGSSPVISHCLFSNTSSQGPNGVAVGNSLNFTSSSGIVDSCRFVCVSSQFPYTAFQSSASSVVFSRCLFNAPSLGIDASFIKNSNGSTNTFSNCRFIKSYNSNKPSIYNDNSKPVFNYCLFDSSRLNIQNVNYAAPVFNNCLSVYGAFMANYRSYPVINNSTIFDATSSGYKAIISNSDSSVVTANNSIFAGVRLSAGELDFKDLIASRDTAILTNCITRNYGQNGVNGNIVNANPRFSQMWDIYGPDKILFTEDDGLRLAKCSPALNKGSNTLTKIQTDVSGKPRVANGTVDIGAYEMQESNTASGSYYVNASATGNNTGTTWQNAYTNLQSAVCNVCADTIRVAAGTYYPATAGRRDSSFLIDRKLTLLGGYPAFGNPGEDMRKPVDQETILSGEIGSKDEIRDNTQLIMLIFGTADTVVVDGFTIRDSYSKEYITPGMLGGGGVLLYYANAIIKNCLFTNNSSIYTCGGGLTVKQNSNVTLKRNIFSSNNGGNEGGGILAAGNINMSDCVLENNNAWGSGGALLSGVIDVHNCIFYNNYTNASNALGSAGGLNISDASGKLYNCIFLKNNASTGTAATGGGVLFADGDLRVRSYNNIFSGNTIGGKANIATADGNHSIYNVNGNNLYQSPTDPFAYNFSGFSASFVDSLHPKGPDGKWFTEDDGLQLAPYSRLINKGTTKTPDNNKLFEGIAFDILGNSRIVLDTVDVGPYEYQNAAVASAGRDTVICQGDSITLGIKGNSRHTYNWTSSPAGFASSLQTPMVKPDIATSYYLVVSNGTTTAYDTVTVKLSNALAPVVNIFADTNRVCAGSAATLYAKASNGGDKPSFQWFVDGVKANVDSTVFSTTAIKDGSEIKVVLKSSLSCTSPLTDTSASFKMAVLPVHTPAVTIAASDTNICRGKVITFSPTSITYGGTKPVYNWFRGGVLQSYDSLYVTSDLLDNDQIVLYVYSNDICISKPFGQSNPVKIALTENLTPEVSINAPVLDACTGYVFEFKANATGVGRAPGYQWLWNNNPVGKDMSTYTNGSMRDGDSVAVILKSDYKCVTSATARSKAVVVKIASQLTPTVTASGNDVVLQGEKTSLYANALNAGTNPWYQWQDRTLNHDWQNIPNANSYKLDYVPEFSGDRVRCMIISNAADCSNGRYVISNEILFTIALKSDDPVVTYPNPVINTLRIPDLNLSDNWQTLEIISIGDGQRVMTQSIVNQTSVEIDVSQLPRGIYMVLLRGGNGNKKIGKFMKV